MEDRKECCEACVPCCGRVIMDWYGLDVPGVYADEMQAALNVWILMNLVQYCDIINHMYQPKLHRDGVSLVALLFEDFEEQWSANQVFRDEVCSPLMVPLDIATTFFIISPKHCSLCLRCCQFWLNHHARYSKSPCAEIAVSHSIVFSSRQGSGRSQGISSGGAAETRC